MMAIIKLVDERKYISQFRRVVTGRGAEEWAYFGAPSSDTRLRIYNKALERGFPSEKWVRFEYQFRNEAADRFLNHLTTCRNLGQAFKDFIDKSVMFTTKPNSESYADHNQSKLKAAKWWKLFVKGAGEITKFITVGVEYNYTALQKYLDIQAGPSIAAFIKANGGDMTPLLELVNRQDDRLNDRQKEVIRERQSRLENQCNISDTELQFIDKHTSDQHQLELKIDAMERNLAKMRAELFG
jgi:DNA relaxase NicK